MALAQSAYYLPAGIAPFVDRRRFEAVTGPKLEWWLVETVGALLVVIGGVLIMSARHDAPSDEAAVLGTATAGILCAIDVTYVSRRRISPVYLADAAVELALVVGWIIAQRETGHARGIGHSPDP
jgi:hypothetical protein